MDKVLSTRLDEAVIQRLGMLAHSMGTTKKDVIERAILAFAEQVEEQQTVDVMRQTSGAWVRDEDAATTVTNSREAFRRGMERHRR
jgi:predicted transcriptional regulator